MLMAAEAVLRCAHARRETTRSPCEEDFPKRDDANWLKAQPGLLLARRRRRTEGT